MKQLLLNMNPHKLRYEAWAYDDERSPCFSSYLDDFLGVDTPRMNPCTIGSLSIGQIRSYPGSSSEIFKVWWDAVKREIEA